MPPAVQGRQAPRAPPFGRTALVAQHTAPGGPDRALRPPRPAADAAARRFRQPAAPHPPPRPPAAPRPATDQKLPQTPVLRDRRPATGDPRPSALGRTPAAHLVGGNGPHGPARAVGSGSGSLGPKAEVRHRWVSIAPTDQAISA